jgi:hypothetical protein
MENDCFWSTRDVSFLEKELVFQLEESIQEKGFSNLRKRRVLYRDHVLSSSS